MDLVGYDEAVYRRVVADLETVTNKLAFERVHFIPVSALRGENVVHLAASMPWYAGPPMLTLLEEIPARDGRTLVDFRFPVQTVLRPSHQYRGFAGQIVSGVIKKGDTVLALPSRKTTRVVGIDTYEGELPEAVAPLSVTLRLADEIDVSRGDMLVDPKSAPTVATRFDAMIVWLHERPLDRDKTYLIKHTTQTTRAQIDTIHHVVMPETLGTKAAETIGLNEIARVAVQAHRPLFIDPYEKNRATGAFILIDSLTNDTVGAGMIAEATREVGAGETAADHTQVSSKERRTRFGHAGVALFVDDTTLAYAIERALFDRGGAPIVFSAAGSALPTTIAAAVAAARAGLVALVVVPTPAETRRATSVDGGPAVFHACRAAGTDPEQQAGLVLRELESAGLVG
jgi:sulfate adenylyltransferase subunit 1 (EFTu-like GTPase family)